MDGDWTIDSNSVEFDGKISIYAEIPNKDSIVTPVSFDAILSASATINWYYEEYPSGYNYSNDTVKFSKSLVSEVDTPVIHSVKFVNDSFSVGDRDDLSLADMQTQFDILSLKSLLDTTSLGLALDKWVNNKVEEVGPPED